MLTKFTTRVSLLLLSLAIYSGTNAQTTINAYAQVYSANLKGGTTVLGNTSMAIKNISGVIQTTQMNETPDANGVVASGNDNSNMQFVDIDGVALTTNSTSADLVLPAGTNTVKFARLYWGGRISNAAITADADTLRKAKIRFGTGAYQNILAPSTSVDIFAVTGSEKIYQTYVDVTAYLQANGAGTYTVADVPATPGSIGGGGEYAGWSIVVAYENTNSLLNSVRIYHGYSQIAAQTSLSVTLSGLNVPNNSLAAGDAVMSTMAWEGDGNLGGSSNNAGDYMQVNGVAVANAVNPATNFWNGSISKNGVSITTKNPSYRNQMGIDIDEVNVGTGFGILPNATSVTLKFGTEADQYFPSYFAFALRVKDPLVTIAKTVADANSNNTIESNEILTYTLSGKNIGPGVAYKVAIVDTLPTNVTYIANSMEVVSGPGAVLGAQTDAVDANDNSSKGTVGPKTYLKFFMGTGSSSTAGGSMQVDETYTVKFKVQGQLIPGSVSNTATSYAYSLANDLFTDISTAVIGPSGGPLSVKLTSFSASLLNDNSAGLKWITQTETNNDYFQVERSDDGIHFTSRGTVTGNGTSGLTHSYGFTDALNTTSKIVYYRLKDIDKDGKFGYSTIVALRLKGASTTVNKFSVYPNPFVTDIKVSLTSATSVTGTFRVFTLNGKEVLNRQIPVQAGDNIVVLKDFGTLATGSYILEVTTPTDKFVSKIIKN
ncbi:MAG: T9SS type A sorting domain-containing protein [Ferruginibacter sp.]